MIERVVVTFFIYFGVVRLFKKKIFYFILEDTFDGYHGHEKKNFLYLVFYKIIYIIKILIC